MQIYRWNQICVCYKIILAIFHLSICYYCPSPEIIVVFGIFKFLLARYFARKNDFLIGKLSYYIYGRGFLYKNFTNKLKIYSI